MSGEHQLHAVLHPLVADGLGQCHLCVAGEGGLVVDVLDEVVVHHHHHLLALLARGVDLAVNPRTCAHGEPVGVQAGVVVACGASVVVNGDESQSRHGFGHITERATIASDSGGIAHVVVQFHKLAAGDRGRGIFVGPVIAHCLRVVHVVVAWDDENLDTGISHLLEQCRHGHVAHFGPLLGEVAGNEHGIGPLGKDGVYHRLHDLVRQVEHLVVAGQVVL